MLQSQPPPLVSDASSVSAPPERLYIYECRGSNLPDREPVHPHFLGIWSEPPHHYYLFFSAPAPGYVADWIRLQRNWALEGSYDLDYGQWQQLPCGEQRVGPFRILTNSNPRTAHAMQNADQMGIPLWIDPGVVFGSGLHPTTRGALLAIVHCRESHSIRTAIDFGTGTGILALACAACGAERVLAVDCNPMAVRAALRNASRNAFEGTIVGVVADSLRTFWMPADLVVMNIEWPSLSKVLQGDDWTVHRTIVVSGFLRAFEPEVVSRFSQGMAHRLVWRHEEDGWPTLLFTGEGSNG